MMMMVGQEGFKRNSGDLRQLQCEDKQHHPAVLASTHYGFSTKWLKNSSFSLKHIHLYLHVHPVLTESLQNDQEYIHSRLLPNPQERVHPFGNILHIYSISSKI